MQIKDIECNCTEYRLKDNSWSFYESTNCKTSSIVINNMLEAGQYFKEFGGLQSICYKEVKSLGTQVTRITCISPCKQIKKVYSFNYANSKYVIQYGI